MAAISGRTRRASGSGEKLLQGRVGLDIHARAHRGAAARGVSIARYLEMLVEADELADTYVEPETLDQLGLSA
ncbi:hypothetical protein [Streptosporangium sp. NPDC048865]|uniref:hypothetical protein n=1 Tax=Streptosporangium sp. NPDC048865 TaxID=3155766 RepID=UPI0034259BDC